MSLIVLSAKQVRQTFVKYYANIQDSFAVQSFLLFAFDFCRVVQTHALHQIGPSLLEVLCWNGHFLLCHHFPVLFCEMDVP